MLTSVRITDLDTIQKHKNNNENIEENVWISTVDREDSIKITEIKNYLKLKNIQCHSEYFYDVDDQNLEEDESPIEWIHNAPNKEHIKRIIDFLIPFIESKQTFKLGINCFAGISRSTALGITAWAMQGLTPKEALDNVLKARFCAWPNLRILRLSSEILNVDLFTPVKQWVSENKGKLVLPVES